MDAGIAAGVAGALGVLAGAAAVLAARRGPGARAASAPTAQAGEPAALPEGAGDVLDVLRSAAVVLDSSDRVLRASEVARQLGIVRGDVLAPEALLALARLVRRDGEVREVELDVPRGPLGSEMTVVVARVAPLGHDLVLVLADDRTESLRLEAVRRDFVANVSHELKTPVGALALLAETVTAASDDPDAVRRFAGRMQREAERLSTLIQDIIDLSRLQGQDALAEPHPVELDHVVVDAVDAVRLAAQAKDIRIVTGGDSGATVLGDEQLLVTALRNLVDNAVNYSPEGTRVAVSVRRVADVVEVSVTDQGIGIPERDLERIFERFYRVDPARSRATGGTGLGLSIVKHVVANHGGELSVWSVEGAGSTFTMRLPAPVGSVAAPAPTPADPATRASGAGQPGWLPAGAPTGGPTASTGAPAAGPSSPSPSRPSPSTSSPSTSSPAATRAAAAARATPEASP
ncbi:MAG TPA: ATP-binding protein [Motilibacteraceae bacterium]|nr:ATP-binding protein [Motilibacteraceae bacterium]